MAGPRKARAVVRRDKETLGLLANGSAGSWDIAVDETTSGPLRWFAQIDGPSVSLYLELPSPGIVGEVLGFLRPTESANGPPAHPFEGDNDLVIGKDKRLPVALVKDDEYRDRYFLVIGRMPNPVVRLTLTGPDLLGAERAPPNRAAGRWGAGCPGLPVRYAGHVRPAAGRDENGLPLASRGGRC
jgi:hypothetical protein